MADPNICHGRLTFKGTRLFVADVLDMLAEGKEARRGRRDTRVAARTAAPLTPSHRVDAARSRDSGESGPGLAIARWIAETHGGTILQS